MENNKAVSLKEIFQKHQKEINRIDKPNYKDINMEEQNLIYNENGINWAWFTELTLRKDKTVTILKHYRLHKGDNWPEKNINAPFHPSFYSSEKWKEGKGRIALEYNVPEVGWCKIRNQQYIFSYK